MRDCIAQESFDLSSMKIKTEIINNVVVIKSLFSFSFYNNYSYINSIVVDSVSYLSDVV